MPNVNVVEKGKSVNTIKMKKNAFRISDILIEKYRGVNNCNIEDCKAINIIVGNNNCGKTSVLDAIKMLSFNDLGNFVGLASLRNANHPIENFRFMFPIDENEIAIKANKKSNPIDIDIKYGSSDIVFKKDIYLDKESPNYDRLSQYIDSHKLDGKQVKMYSCSFKYNDSTNKYTFVPLDLYLGTTAPGNFKRIIQYETPTNHFNIDPQLISVILQDLQMKRIFIKVLQIFDEGIVDVQILVPNDIGDPLPVVYVYSNNKSPMPLSLFGDGIKKVVCLAYALALSKDAILLVDEIETSLHHSYYDDIFKFIIKVSQAYNIQIFITTHDAETIDAFLKAEEELNGLDSLNIYTIRKGNDKTHCRKIGGKEAVFLRFNADFEVRD